MSEFERARVALGYVPPDDRDTWRQVGMAVKAEFGEEGFSLWSEWSQGAQSYNAKDARDVWKSFKGGKITINTLYHLAKRGGFDPRAHRAKPINPAERERQLAERAAREAAELTALAEKQQEAAALAESIWSEAKPALADHPYLVRKRIPAGDLRIYRGNLRIGTAACDGALIIPACDADGKLWTLEFILEDGQKRYLPNGRKSGCLSMIGGAVSSTLLIGEGYATCATLAAATGHPAAVAFDAGNLMAVATALRGCFPAARIIVCADDDHTTKGNPGVTKARAAAHAVGGEVALPDFGADRPAAGTDFNDMAAHRGMDAVAAAVRAALAVGGSSVADKGKAATSAPKPAKRPKTTQTGDGRARFRVDGRGVWYEGYDRDGNDLPPQWICDPLEVAAETRNEANTEWGVLLQFADRDGNPKRWAMPRRMLAGDGAEYRAILLDMGLNIDPSSSAKQRLTSYIQTARSDLRARCTSRIGWHGNAFVLPDRTIGAGDDLTIFQTDGSIESHFKQSGTLDDWRRELAALCVGNSRLMFCVSSAFAGTLLRFSGQASGGFHLMGNSTVGKTTALRAAASVFGGRDYMRSWRATSNAMESTAAQHSDGLLILDEIGQVEPKEVGDIVYMIGNEAGKGRATRNATAKPVLVWRLLFLSSGEKTLASIMGEASKTANAGQDVRLATIPADAGRGYGIFEELHGFETPKDLADHVARASGQYYGVAAMEFIRHTAENADRMRDTVSGMIAALVADWVPQGSDGQVSRVAQRFALVGVAGEIASEAGCTGWGEGHAIQAARACFKAWVRERGGVGNAEATAMIRQVRGFLEAHGDARFTWVQRVDDDHAGKTMHRAGFKRSLSADRAVNTDREYMAEYGEKMTAADAERSATEFLVLTEPFRNEVCRGFDHRAVARVLADMGVLRPESNGRADSKVRVGAHGPMRAYRIQSSIFALDIG
ncbi:primase 2 family protein [Burkholderia thailandensis USAMRU Malaysia |uniref:DUF927 domain-containing protein n=1 Tax=pseudomallei group TaxID=111527 RepID=UPI0003EC7E86|nr:DUF927 domain-containing protein [Burkholderia thailandensis]AHI78648.1 primase C terminal 2 family protein [Burkholderia thailandensis E444]AIC88058.1 primase 2 family protein [Burkholderia thailandensis USAMRU Malaysia \